jgi:hypothetical protein
MMTQKKPPKTVPTADPEDPFKMRGIEQILTLFDGGSFLQSMMQQHAELLQEMAAHAETYGPKGCEGEMILRVKYASGNGGDVSMGARVEFKPPKKPASSAAAYINEAGELSLYSPMMARMQRPVRDATDYDPDTGEIRNPD